PYTAYDLRTPAASALLPAPDEELSDRFLGTVPDVFAARAAEAPERVALTGHGVTWTYGALDRGASRLARTLAAAGVGRGQRAVIWAHRSPSLPLAVLGVLRAGAAYVILDPVHPARHLVELVERARPRAAVRLAVAGLMPEALEEALTRLALAADLELPPPQAGPVAPLLHRVPEARPAPGDDPDRPPAMPLGPDDHAVLTFTSGTTGVPKGIVGRHGPLSHFIPWQRRRLGLSPDDRYTMLSGLAHDPLQRDLFTPFQTGATLCVPPADDVLVPARLFAWMERERTTVAHLTPAMGQLVASGAAEGSGADGLAALRRAFFVGEQLSPVLVDELFRLAPRLDCFNYYGTTETQRAVGFFPVPRDAARRFRSGIPLGRGIEDVQILVLGPSGGLAGVSELGEIAVRSPHLARGYLDDPALTAARFTPDPFGSGRLAGGRIYRTGDLGRYRPDGAVEFSTRADDQVQIRGFRVELGAVENALAGHPGVAEAAVAARPGPDGASYLAGYVVPAAGAAAPDAGELRAYLADRLPGYMVPGVFVPLPALPLTRTSKVDRRALPDPGALPAADDFEPPGSPVEELLAGIWRDLLRVDRTGANDDFFALGGHSLLATRVVSRLRAEVGLEIPLRTLFEKPRLRDLALAVEDLLLADAGENPGLLNPQ
ncbi:MAG TPA: amino acid adenylation domain-containing protein, partial [Thermoanaerobaculia bacterium]|nr:amino acid adenylation domain-containing protein [Thermoanaerobaculia bacterium]